MFHTDDTIVAVATPAGRSGVGIVRLSGPESARLAAALVGRSRPLQPRRATFARLASHAASDPTRDARGSAASDVRDQVIVTAFPAPHSYTGQDVAEISAHGSPIVLQGILRAAIDAGARLAEPGEFTLRAFLNGKLDLIQAEAVADLIDAVTPLQARTAFDQLEGTLTTTIGSIEAALFDLRARLEASLDFPDEGYHFVQPNEVCQEVDAIRARIDTLLKTAARGRLIREGAQLAILGTPNVGKSSLFNALLNTERAIVTSIAGTTRDLLTERADIRGISVALVDTAGIRESADVVEREGVARARRAAAIADLTILVLDRSRALSADDRALIALEAARPRLTVINKIDLPQAWSRNDLATKDAVEISLKSGEGLDALIDRLGRGLADGPEIRDQPLVTNLRHITLLEQARSALTRVTDALSTPGSTLSEEFLLADLQDAADHLQEVTGRRTTDELLRHIFERFCIGK